MDDAAEGAWVVGAEDTAGVGELDVLVGAVLALSCGVGGEAGAAYAGTANDARITAVAVRVERIFIRVSYLRVWVREVEEPEPSSNLMVAWSGTCWAGKKKVTS